MGFMRTAYDAFKFFVALRVQLQGAFGSHAGLLRFDPYALWLKFFAVTGMRIRGPRGRWVILDRGTFVTPSHALVVPTCPFPPASATHTPAFGRLCPTRRLAHKYSPTSRCCSRVHICSCRCTKCRVRRRGHVSTHPHQHPHTHGASPHIQQHALAGLHQLLTPPPVRCC